MRKLLLLLSSTCLLMVACSKTKDDSQHRKFVSMMLDSAFVIGENPQTTLNYIDPTTDNPQGFPRLLLSGTSYSKTFFSFSITSTDSQLHPGTYTSSQSGNFFTMIDSTFNTLTADVDNGALTFVILSVQDSVVQGEFFGTIVDQNDGTSHKVDRGNFRTTFHKQ